MKVHIIAGPHAGTTVEADYEQRYVVLVDPGTRQLVPIDKIAAERPYTATTYEIERARIGKGRQLDVRNYVIAYPAGERLEDPLLALLDFSVKEAFNKPC